MRKYYINVANISENQKNVLVLFQVTVNQRRGLPSLFIITLGLVYITYQYYTCMCSQYKCKYTNKEMQEGVCVFFPFSLRASSFIKHKRRKQEGLWRWTSSFDPLANCGNIEFDKGASALLPFLYRYHLCKKLSYLRATTMCNTDTSSLGYPYKCQLWNINLLIQGT